MASRPQTASVYADSELHQGSVIWRIEKGHGRFEGASGLITSNFLLDREPG